MKMRTIAPLEKSEEKTDLKQVVFSCSGLPFDSPWFDWTLEQDFEPPLLLIDVDELQ